MKLRRKSSEEISGFLDQDTAVTGDLQFSGTLRIDGHFHGSITTNDVLIIGEHAVVNADIRAGSMEIHGRVFGNIEATRRIEVFPTGCIRGDIHAPHLIINEGATFDGHSHMSDGASGTEQPTEPGLIESGSDGSH